MEHVKAKKVLIYEYQTGESILVGVGARPVCGATRSLGSYLYLAREEVVGGGQRFI